MIELKLRRPSPPKERKSRIVNDCMTPKQTAVFGIVFILVMFVVVFITASVANAQDPKKYIPPKAFDYRDTLFQEVNRYVPEIPDYNFIPSIIEHESCISLKHSKCWSPNAELKTSREQGVGFFQLTRAWNPDGSLRMDTIQGLKNRYTTHLKELTWNNVKDRPDLQFRAGILLMMENLNKLDMIEDPTEKMAFLAAMHNGGNWPIKERRTCGLKAGCDPQKWFGNVENACMRSKKPMANYGNRSICDIAKAYPRDVIYTRLPKYQDQYFTEDYLKSKGIVSKK